MVEGRKCIKKIISEFKSFLEFVNLGSTSTLAWILTYFIVLSFSNYLTVMVIARDKSILYKVLLSVFGAFGEMLIFSIIILSIVLIYLVIWCLLDSLKNLVRNLKGKSYEGKIS